MTRYITARKALDGRWFSTCKMGKNIFLVGYCILYIQRSPEMCKSMNLEYDKQLEKKLEVYQDKYHLNGHDTKEEANKCYYNYMLDNELKHVHIDDWQASACHICGKLSVNGIEPDIGNFIWLCSQHYNRKEIEIIVPFNPDLLVIIPS